MIIGITGTLGAGKGTIVEFLKTKGFTHFSAREDVINHEIERRNLPITRDNMREVANELRTKYGSSHVAEELFKMAEKKGGNSVLESLRTEGEITKLREIGNFVLFAVDADQKLRFNRVQIRNNSQSDNVDFEKFRKQEEAEFKSTNPANQNLSRCIEIADYKFNNNKTKEELFAEVQKVLDKIEG